MASKEDLRQLMKKSAAERKTKIDSPYAKYSAKGELQCSLCGNTIKTEALWPVHVKSKSHKELQAQVENSKKKAASKAAAVEQDKDLMPPPPPAKKQKETPSGLPAGFFDQYGGEDNADGGEEPEEAPASAPAPSLSKAAAPAPEPEPEPIAAPKSNLPAGFFDDPTIDAEMRGTKTPAQKKGEEIDKMYEKYQEALGEELHKSDKIRVEELLKDESIDDESNDNQAVDREQERLEREAKVNELKEKAEKVQAIKQRIAAMKRKKVEVTEDDLISPDAFDDWRAKSSILNT